MATKYTTYTLPALLPIAILMARYLYQREVLVKRTVIGAIVVYGILTFALAIPACSDEGYSGKNIAAAYKDVVKDDDLVVSYGDYKTSIVFMGRKWFIDWSMQSLYQECCQMAKAGMPKTLCRLYPLRNCQG